MSRSQNDFDFRTISDIDRSRQRIIDCKLKSRWPRGFCIDGSPFVFAAVKRIHAYLGSRKTFAHLIKGGTLFPPQSPSRKRVARIFALLPREEEEEEEKVPRRTRWFYANLCGVPASMQTTIRSFGYYRTPPLYCSSKLELAGWNSNSIEKKSMYIFDTSRHWIVSRVQDN